MSGFDDLEEAVGDDDVELDDETPPDSDGGAAAGGGDEVVSSDPLQESAFPFDEVKQYPFYTRESSLDEFERVRRFDINRVLHESGVEDEVPKREIHDAVLRLAAAEPNRVAELVLEARGVDVDVE